MVQLSKVDDLIRPDHSYLGPEDECFFIRSYKPREGFLGGDTNSLILNFKKQMDRKGLPEWHYKNLAIKKIAEEFASTIPLPWLQQATLIPIPPSKARENPLYDDRMLQVLYLVSKLIGITCDIRDLILHNSDMISSHQTELRPTSEEIQSNYKFNPSLIHPMPRLIALFDDVLTTGAHFIACKDFLIPHFPSVPIVGIFVARREPF